MYLLFKNQSIYVLIGLVFFESCYYLFVQLIDLASKLLVALEVLELEFNDFLVIFGSLGPFERDEVIQLLVVLDKCLESRDLLVQIVFDQVMGLIIRVTGMEEIPVHVQLHCYSIVLNQ